jgi:membrane protease YdiL (CAAX protease family)
MEPAAPSRKHVILILLAMTLALFLRAWLQSQLQGNGWERRVASDLSYLVVPPILAIFLYPVLLHDRSLLACQFRRQDLALRVVVSAVLIALLFRAAWWGQLVARVSFGWQQARSSVSLHGPSISLNCPEPELLLLGVIVTSVFIPVVEEITNRGYVQAYFHPRGPVFSILIASLVFMTFHLYQGWLFALAGGLVLGSVYWFTRSLWAPIICHSVINLTPQFTWRCLNPAWNPDPLSLPLWTPGIAGILAFVISAAAIIALTLTLGGRRDA